MSLRAHIWSLISNRANCTFILFAVQLGKGEFKIKLTAEAEEKVTASRNLIDEIVKENRVVYGITTGFGKFARTVIEKGLCDTFQIRKVFIELFRLFRKVARAAGKSYSEPRRGRGQGSHAGEDSDVAGPQVEGGLNILIIQ